MKRKKIFTLCLIFILLFSSLGVHAAGSTKTKDLTSTINVTRSKGRKMKTSEVNKLTSASFRLLKGTMKNEDSNKNVLISPTSIMFAFGLAENGARSKTRCQMENVINGGVKTGDTNKILCNLMNSLENSDEVEWNVANSVWIRDRKDVKVKKSYLRTSAMYYDAEIFKAPFDGNTVKDVNGWVKKNTNNMIPKIVDHFDEDTIMCLINAMAFEGTWQEPFEKERIHKNQIFTNLDGSKSRVTMMNGSVSGYFELYGAKGFKKYYKGGQYAFVGIEMPENVKPVDYISRLSKNGAAFNRALSKMKYDRKVSISVPKFEVDYDTEMSKNLKKMGITCAFNPKKANLYNMFEKDKDSNYFISKVIHKTHIEVDKNGTKAAAATAVLIDKNTTVVDPKMPISINLDHPFIYAIVDTDTNLPLYIGCTNTLGK